jgi:hypothetical protein
MHTATIQCPYCGESFETTVDCLAGSQQYIEDCPVCCRPIEFDVVIGPQQEPDLITVRRDDE